MGGKQSWLGFMLPVHTLVKLIEWLERGMSIAARISISLCSSLVWGTTLGPINGYGSPFVFVLFFVLTSLNMGIA